MKKLIKAMMCIGVLVLPVLVVAQPEGDASAALPLADEVVKRVNSRDEGGFVSRKLSMKLVDRRGKVRERETMGYRKDYEDVKRTVLFYLFPKNVKNTAFLTFDYHNVSQDDNQWLYLPATKKIRRISSGDRGNYFLGTDLSYDDIKRGTRVSEEDYTFTTVGEDAVEGHHCILIEGIPLSEAISRELGYSKVEACIDSKVWMPLKTRYWDIRGNLLKTVVAGDVREVQGIWTQHTLDVENHKTGHSTFLIYSEVDYKTEIDDDIFTKKALKRGL